MLIVIILAIILIIITMKFLESKSTAHSNLIKSDDEFLFFIISDPHFISKKAHDNGKAFNSFIMSGDKLVQYTYDFINAIKENVIEKKPSFILVAGDLTCNGLKESHLDLSKKFKEIEKEGTSIFVIPGNHDIMNGNSMYFYKDKSLNSQSITKESFTKIYADYGYNDAISLDKESLSYLVAPTEKKWLLMIDSTNDYPDVGGSIKTSTLYWIEKCSKLAENNNASLIAVMHHNLIHHSKIINKDYTICNSEECLEVFHKCNIDVVLTGHIHLQDIKSHNYGDKILYDIATSCLVVYPHQYGEIQYLPNKGYNYRTQKLDMEKYAFMNKINDEALINFEKYSEEFFKRNCCKNQKTCIGDLEELSEEQKNEVFSVVSEINKRYFSGFRNEALDDLLDTKGFNLLKNLPPCNIRNYVMAILNDERTNNNLLFIPENN
ncbi:metallophosphoesterase [Sedimentibacter acidaminivorans]|nr:metallophosphoesterase [Sedimentibacter acidaminivorans]